MQWDLIVVGRGVAATLFAYLYLRRFQGQRRVLQISAKDLFPPASPVPLALLALAGIRSGVSPLGEALIQSWQLASAFFHEQRPPGVEHIPHWNMAFPDSGKHWESYLSRYQGDPGQKVPFAPTLQGQLGEAWVVESEVFLSWLEQQSALLGLKQRQGQVTELAATLVKLSSAETLTARQIVYAPGAWANLGASLPTLPPTLDTYVSALRPVRGSQWQARANLGKKSFCYTLAKANLIYSASTQSLAVGSTSAAGSLLAHDVVSLQQQYQLLAQTLGLDLPPFDQGRIFSAVRAKGPGRRPWWGPVAKTDQAGLWAILGLYKSGHTLAHLAAAELLPNFS